MGDQTHQRWAWGLPTSCWFMFNCIAYVWTQQTNNANLVVSFIGEWKKRTHCALNLKKRRIKPEKRFGLHHPIECTEYAFAYANKKKPCKLVTVFILLYFQLSLSWGRKCIFALSSTFLLFRIHSFFSCISFGFFAFFHAWRANLTNKKQRSPSYIYFWLVKCIKCVHAVYFEQSVAFRLIYAT